jgi:hypothetical protein
MLVLLQRWVIAVTASPTLHSMVVEHVLTRCKQVVQGTEETMSQFYKTASGKQYRTCFNFWKTYVVAIILQQSLPLCVSSCKANGRGKKQRSEVNFFSGEPLRALSTLVYSDNVDLQRSASLTFAEITERGGYHQFAVSLAAVICMWKILNPGM